MDASGWFAMRSLFKAILVLLQQKTDIKTSNMVI